MYLFLCSRTPHNPLHTTHARLLQKPPHVPRSGRRERQELGPRRRGERVQVKRVGLQQGGAAAAGDGGQLGRDGVQRVPVVGERG